VQEEGDGSSVIEVHPPEEPLRGWRDFLIHLATITIGLLIALSLEGCVEFWHHRSLVHEAEESMQVEIRANAKELQGALDDVRKEQEYLSQDIAVMKKIIAHPNETNREDLTINFRIRGFNNVSWKTAESTGALSYMPYERAKEYSNLYGAQNEIDVAEHQAIRDTVLAIAPFVGSKKGEPNPGGEEAVKIADRLEILQGQLIFLESQILGLDAEFKKFIARHPG
jgi:hypothetical protein